MVDLVHVRVDGGWRQLALVELGISQHVRCVLARRALGMLRMLMLLLRLWLLMLLLLLLLLRWRRRLMVLH